MKKFLYKILFVFLILFSFIFVHASEINPGYEEYLKLSDGVKNEMGLVPNEYVNYYKIDNNLLNKNRVANLYGNSISSYDLRNVSGKRLIPDVKNQNPLSLCWAFATNNMIESYMLKKGKTYNLSENHLDYVARYYKDTNVFGQANSYFNAIKYLFYGYGPFSEDVFGSYFTSNKNMSYSSYLDYDNTLFDISEVVVFPMIRMSYLKENFPVEAIKSNVENYNMKMKEHIMNYGAIASGVYWDFYDENKNLVYNDGSLTREEYMSSGHAITIIGWDDNYGSVNIKGTTFTGSWLAMNSWGNDIQYFYISYYDENVVESLIGVKEIRDKNWDNVYFENNLIESSTNKQVYEFTKDNINEKINSVKVFHYDSDDAFTVSVSDGYKVYKSSSKSVTYGINTFDFSDVSFDSEKVYVTVENKNGKNSYYVSLYTSNEVGNKSINILENKSSVYGTTIKHDIRSKGIDTGVKYSIKVYDQNSKDISSSFSISESMIINDVSKLNIVVTGNISYSDFIKIVVSGDGLSDELILYKSRTGSESDPFIIRKSSEMSSLKNNYYFELGNDIDMRRETTNMYGDFYNLGTGWNPSDFVGNLNGNGYKITNLYSKNGSLFKTINGGTIKNINIDNFEIEDSKNTYGYTGIIGRSIKNDSVLSNILVSNSTIDCTKTLCGIVSGNMYNGDINNIHIYNSSINGNNAGYVTAYIENPSSQINISNVFVNDSFLNSGDNYLVGNIYIYSKVANLKNINIKNNLVNGSDKSKNLIGSKTINISDNSSYDIYKEKLIISDNYVKNDEEVLDMNSFNKYDFSLWNHDSNVSLYLVLFSDEYLLNENKLLSLDGYFFRGNIIQNININTDVNKFIKNIRNKDDLSVKFYSPSNVQIKDSNIISTGSYVDVSRDGSSERYYLVVDGDVNSDGKLSIFDIVKINNHIVDKSKKLDGIYYMAADYNKDGNVSIFDIVKINNQIVGGK